MKKYLVFIGTFITLYATAQHGITNTTESPHAVLTGVNMGDVRFTNGFWAERFETLRDSMVPHLWNTYMDKNVSHSFENFRIAAGIDTGSFSGPSFHDGDFYKTLEAVAALYASTKDPALDTMMDDAIAVIAKAQRPDGYIYTKSIIEHNKTGRGELFDDKLSFEAYNLGHLMTAACVHYRATGKTTLLEIAKRGADFLLHFYTYATPEQARNAICPSHYMGLAELYRTTHEKKYLTLVEKLIDIRGIGEGSDDNSDRLPFRDMREVNGHAVRANYLFAGAADVYAESGDSSLLRTLDVLWNDVTNHKMYVTGGCGALYDGLSKEGITYHPDSIEKIQQAYGKAFQLPNLMAHNETCANVGNLLWNWRMFLITGDAKYTDIVELELYNSILSGISMDGNKFFYTNPLAASKDFPYDLRWSGGRKRYISLSNCCPPNAVRTIAEVNDYMYSIGDDGLYINLYGGNKLSTRLKDGTPLVLEQKTEYPWKGRIITTIAKSVSKPVGIHFRIPGWCKQYTLRINDRSIDSPEIKNGYVNISRVWKSGDRVTLTLDMPATLLESNPLVESNRNQVAVKRGPVVYCLESTDLPGVNVFDVMIPSAIKLYPEPMKIDIGNVTTLTGNALVRNTEDWQDKLYQEVNTQYRNIPIKLIPYFAWANRGSSDMTVWMPFTR